MVELVLGNTVPAAAGGTVTNCTTYGPWPGTLAAALVGGGTVTFACGGTIIVPDIAITVDTTIDASARMVALSGNRANRVFSVFGARLELIRLVIQDGRAESGGALLAMAGATVTLNGCAVIGNTAFGESVGSSVDGGGGIYLRNATAVLDDTTVSGNSAQNGSGLFASQSTVTLRHSQLSYNTQLNRYNPRGGGVWAAESNVTLTQSTVTHNVSGYGGGLFTAGGTLTLTDSVVTENSADAVGGGLAAYTAGTTVTNSTISGNSAEIEGGGLAGGGTFTNTTVTGNSALYGGGVRIYGSAILKNTIVARQAGGADCMGITLDSQSYNLDSDGTCRLTGAGDQPGVDPRLGPLQDNGGPTHTHALPADSPAVDAIPAGANGCATLVIDDQRGVARPQGAGCDIGAFEASPRGVPWGVATASFLPLQDGYSWTYDRQEGGTTIMTVLPGTVAINDVPTKILQSSSGAQNFYTSDAFGIRQHRIFDPGGGLGPATWTYSPPAVLASSNATLGQAMHSTGTVLLEALGSSYRLNYAASSIVEGLDTVSGPLGPLVAAKVVVTVSTWGSILGTPVDQTVRQTVWLANHIGIVTLEDESGRLTLLATNVPPPSAGLVAAVLPSSRSVQTGRTATAFATIIATGSGTATGCFIAPLKYLPGMTFLYQTTDPETNALVGLPNTPTDIPAGRSQSYLVAATPVQEISPTEVPFAFSCTNAGPAPVFPGVNTLWFSAFDAPGPDVIALAMTRNNDGIVNIPGSTGAGAFAVATANVGTSGRITVSLDTGGQDVPVVLSLCQTNPASGQCVSDISPSVEAEMNANETATFGVFIGGTGPISDDPANHRIFVRFRDANGVTRGATSVAVRTQ